MASICMKLCKTLDLIKLIMSISSVISLLGKYSKEIRKENKEASMKMCTIVQTI